MGRRSTTAIVLCALAACAPGAPDADDFRERAAKVCEATAREIRAIRHDPSLTVKEDADVPAYADAILAINEANSAAIRRLQPPAELRRGVREMLAEVTNINDALNDAAAAAEVRNVAALDAARAEIDAAAARLQQRARALGIPECAGGTS